MSDEPTFKEMVQELEGMSKAVNSWEANFLQSMFYLIKAGLAPNQEQLDKVRQIHTKYLCDQDAEIDF